MRGYIHGGLLIDFVGELGPISKFRLGGLDILVLVMQCVILAVVLEKEDLKSELEGNTTRGGEAGLTGQDHDAEEQGVLRSEIVEREEGVEMQNLSSSTAMRDNDQSRVAGEAEEQESLFEASSSHQRIRGEHPLDTFNSGQYIIANLHIIDALQSSYRRWKEGRSATAVAPSPTAQSIRDSLRYAAGRAAERRRRRSTRMIPTNDAVT